MLLNVRYWHLADMPSAPHMSAIGGKADMRTSKCPLMTQSGRQTKFQLDYSPIPCRDGCFDNQSQVPAEALIPASTIVMMRSVIPRSMMHRKKRP